MIGIVILNYKNWKVTQQCVNSIKKNPPGEPFKIIVVDNGSGNNSLTELNKAFKNEENIIILSLEKNLGFASGNNKGIKICKDMKLKECILSNSDVLFTEGSIDRLIDDIKNNKVVIACPKIIRGGVCQHSSRLKKGRLIDPLEIGRFFPVKKLDEYNGKGLHEVFSVSGCCFAININRFKAMGAFDENTFLYNEENILGMQAEKAGYKIVIDLDVTIYHEHGASSGVDNDFVRTEYIKSTLYYWHRYRGKGRLICNLILNAFITKLKLQCHPNIHPDEIKKASLEYLKKLMIK